MEWNLLSSRAPLLLGYIPQMVSAEDPRPAAEQFNENYAHGGGWRPLSGWEMKPDGTIKYPGDPAMKPVAYARLRDEVIFVYEHAWVGIAQVGKPDKFEVSRMD